MNLLLTSCVEEPETPKIETIQSSQISKVKDWFEENKTKLRIPDRGMNFRTESQELILPFFEKEPDWDKFHQYKFPDGREVFEVNLENAIKYFPTSMRDSFPSGNPDEFVIQNIMFVKHPTENRFDPLIVRYFPTSPSSKKSFKDMNYASIDYDWSGKIELFTYDERHFIGFEIKEGEVTSHYRLKPFEGDKKKSTTNYDYTCWTTYYPVGYSVTTTNPDGTKTTHYVIEREIAQTNCSGSSGGDSYQIFYYFGGESGEPTGTPTDGNGTCSSCEYDPPIVVKPGIINNLNNICASNIFKQLKKLGITLLGQSANPDGNFNISNEAIKAFYESLKYDIVIQNSNLPNQTVGSRNFSTNTIQWTVNLNNDYLGKASQLSIARTIIHELLHAYISYQLQTDIFYNGQFMIEYSDYIKQKDLSNIQRAQHELMGEYVEMMAYSLKTWDFAHGNGFQNGILLDDNYYRSLAFGGLFKDNTNNPTDSFKALVPNISDQQKIIDIIKKEQDGDNPKGTICN